MNISEKFQDLLVAENETCSDEIKEFIAMHNKSISEFAQGLTMTAVVSILIKKNIISEDEFSNEVLLLLHLDNNKANIQKIENNRDLLLQLIECEVDYNQNLSEMHENLVEQDGVEMMLNANTNVSVEPNTFANCTDAESANVNSFIE